AELVAERPDLSASVHRLAKRRVTAALVTTSQVGKLLTHSINRVRPIAVIVGEECRNAVNEIRDDLNISSDRLHWFADQNTQADPGQAPAGFINLAEKIDLSPKFNPPTTHSVQGKDGLFYIYTSGTTGLPKAVIFTNGRWTLAYGTYGHVLNLKKN